MCDVPLKYTKLVFAKASRKSRNSGSVFASAICDPYELLPLPPLAHWGNQTGHPGRILRTARARLTSCGFEGRAERLGTERQYVLGGSLGLG